MCPTVNTDTLHTFYKYMYNISYSTAMTTPIPALSYCGVMESVERAGMGVVIAVLYEMLYMYL